MQEYTFHDELWLPHRREDVFSFFADAANLEKITPPWLSFHILTPSPIAMRQGALIDYKLRVHGIPIRWQTEIVEWNPPHHFIDVQRKGPYFLWHHTHTFVEKPWGTVCIDDVRYNPMGGWLANALFVRHDVNQIFAYRRTSLMKIFSD